MKIYLKSCSLFEVKNTVEYNLINGVNLISETEDEPCIATDNDKTLISQTVRGPVFISVCGRSCEQILSNSRRIIEIAPNVVLKLKVGLESIKACSILSSNDVSICMCGIESLTQALISARAGADFIGITGNNFSENKTENIAETISLINKYEFQTEIIIDYSDQLIESGPDAIFISHQDLIGQLDK
ncbi:transaldolase family protein [Maridesulfovibrio zosterae]|uniref:transaldolase family protein n=1 Tax=Maridesulfovibrio zosterae TaxID=82171 RepID=UPI0003F9DBC8|nr:transaldolase family protein [Maridesulfovibrio zosterae]